MVKGHAKGSEFERRVCKQLSKWWSDGERDDIFWRTAGSGAMAKTRSKTGGAAFGQYGDIQAMDPIGQHFIDFCTLELKKGYPPATLQDVVDTLPRYGIQPYEDFFTQAKEDHNNAGSCFWACIIGRNRREPIIVMPFKMFKAIENAQSSLREAYPSGVLRFRGHDKQETWNIFYTTLKAFLKKVHPIYIEEALRATQSD